MSTARLQSSGHYVAAMTGHSTPPSHSSKQALLLTAIDMNSHIRLPFSQNEKQVTYGDELGVQVDREFNSNSKFIPICDFCASPFGIPCIDLLLLQNIFISIVLVHKRVFV